MLYYKTVLLSLSTAPRKYFGENENGNQITSKTTYYYDLHKMDLSDLMQMIEEVSANYHGNISYNATKCWGISDLMQESMDYDAHSREMLFDLE